MDEDNVIKITTCDDNQKIDDVLKTNEFKKMVANNLKNSEQNNEDDGETVLQYERGKGIERYTNALKNLLPIRGKAKDGTKMSIDNASLLSTICVSWMSNIMYKAYRKGITVEELPGVSPYDAAVYNAKRLEYLWEEELAEKGCENSSFSRVVWKFSRTRVIACCLVYTSSLISGFVSYTYAMRKLLEYVESGNGSYREGMKWALFLLITELLRTLYWSWAWVLSHRTALRIKAACTTLLYKKIIAVDNLASKNVGQVINMFSNDAHRIFELLLVGPMVIGAPISTLFGLFYILRLFGPIGLLGMIAFLLFYPIQYLLSRFCSYLQNKEMKISDMRIRLTNEILDCIKLIKMYAWEKRFSDEILSIRNNERKIIVKTEYCHAFGESMAPTIPVISAIITFLSYAAVGNNLTPAKVFPYTTLLDSGIRLSLYLFQNSIQVIVAAGVSLERIKKMLVLEDGNCTISKPTLESQAIAIVNGTFAYNDFESDDETENNDRTSEGGEKRSVPETNDGHVTVLSDVSFEAEKGKLVGVCGSVGSGKSSLLLAALGQLRMSNGEVRRDGDCAYVSQQAWITNATLRENILFGAKFDEVRYNETIRACSLKQDIDMFPGGDQTEIGEKGINLSGGQKQRVALARALYADRDIYLLDDPLSAVDSRVGSYLFDNLILGALRGKTVVFVTHQIQYLNRCDDVYMMREGRIVEHGTHDQLIKLDNEYASMVRAISSENIPEDKTISDQETEYSLRSPEHAKLRNRTTSHNSHSAEDSDQEMYPNVFDTQLTVAENMQQGSIMAHTYHSYIMAAGGYLFFVVVLSTFLAVSASIVFSSWWLAFWMKAGSGNVTIVRNNETVISENINDNPNYVFYQSIYASTIGFMIFATALRSLVYTKATTRASTKIHNTLFKKIITSPMRFFDTTPVGRIQHLFSRDLDDVDHRLPYSVACILDNMITIFFTMLIICTVFPWFVVPLVVIAASYYFFSKIFRIGIRDLKRMDNVTRAPVMSFVTATVEGLSTIHAFAKESDFLKKFTYLYDENSKCTCLYSGALRWLAMRIDLLSIAITGITALLVITFQDKVPPALAGLALAYSAQISDILQYTIRMLTETEVQFIGVERMTHYIKTLKIEGSAKPCTAKVQPSWPTEARIKFDNVTLAYGEGTPTILKNVSFTINAGEKIGIVGRTGAGKSSLTVALFRLVELAEGRIEIDDVDVSGISLEQLRSKLSIIPQDPVLFSGTVRSNLDPFKLYTDALIWEALEKTELKTRVRTIPGQLDASVGFGGDNMSVGERQLLCLARALLRNSKILVLDEATAAVDPETEKAVQKTVQREFSECTILIIAHRLQTVVSLNRVLVMNDGKVLEFDTPSNLLKDQNSEFSKMMAAAEQSEMVRGTRM